MFYPCDSNVEFSAAIISVFTVTYRNYSNMLNWSPRTISYYVEDSGADL